MLKTKPIEICPFALKFDGAYNYFLYSLYLLYQLARGKAVSIHIQRVYIWKGNYSFPYQDTLMSLPRE